MAAKALPMTVAQRMEEKLRDALQPTRLQIDNVSCRHHGHASSPGTGESHFEVAVVSERFTGLSRVARHKLIYSILADEMAGPVHALALTALAPGE